MNVIYQAHISASAVKFIEFTFMNSRIKVYVLSARRQYGHTTKNKTKKKLPILDCCLYSIQIFLQKVEKN